MNTIFSKQDFKLCTVPVPQGYLQSQTHSGVALHDGSVYMTTSPFPAFKAPRWKVVIDSVLQKLFSSKGYKPFVPEQYENPLLYIGIEDNRYNYSHTFKLLQSSPLMSPPDPYYGLPAFNSDPDIFIENDIIHILNRQTYRTELCPGKPLNKYLNRLYHIYGLIDHKRFKYLGTELLVETERQLVSPCLTKYREEYILTELETNAYNDGQQFKGLYVNQTNEIFDLKKPREWKEIVVKSYDFLPWHMSLFQYKDRLYTIVACVKKGEKHRLWQMLGEFSQNLEELTIYKTPLTDYKSYRGAGFVDDNGEFVLYSTTVREEIKGGKSVDGREVIVAHMPFEILIKTLKERDK